VPISCPSTLLFALYDTALTASVPEATQVPGQMEKNEVTRHATERSNLSETNAAPGSGKGAKVNGHFQRFWLLYIGVCVVVVLVITLPL